MLSITDLKIAVIGLGYVDLPLTVEFGKSTCNSFLVSTKNDLMKSKI